MVEKAWERIPRHFPMVVPDSIGIVPDHVYMILCFEPGEGKRPVLGTVVGRFKSDVSCAISRHTGLQGKIMPGSIWQIKFYDHVIRDEREFERERRYVLENPEKHQLRDEERGREERLRK
jgi:putative transposase